MSVRRETRRDPKTGKQRSFLMVDIDLQLPNGRRRRVRKVSPVQTQRGAEQYERLLRNELIAGTWQAKEEDKEVPTLTAFSDEFLSVYAKTNNKPSEVATKESILRVHLKPWFGRQRLNTIGPREIERFKARKLQERASPKSINNYLTVLRKLLSVAQEWGVLDHVPPIKWLKVPPPKFDFLGFTEAERLVEAAEPEWRAFIITALKTGMRLGELIALRWEDVDLVAGRLVVRRSASRGIVGTPKNGRTREIPLSGGLRAVLKAHLHLRGELVFCQPDGSLLTKNIMRRPLRRACTVAGLRRVGWHALRHTFASHLVMRGAQLKVVQELLGHATMEMTMRYAHLAPRVRQDAVNLLDTPAPTRDENETAASGA